MKQYPFIVLLFLVIYSCDERSSLSVNPLEPNIEVTLEDIKRWGFGPISFDHRICMFSKSVEASEIHFFADNDSCSNVRGQSIRYKLDTLHYAVEPKDFNDENYDKWFKMNKLEFQKDSLKIIKLIEDYGGEKVSLSERVDYSENLRFDVRKKGSKDTVEVIYSAYPQRERSILFETYWK